MKPLNQKIFKYLSKQIYGLNEKIIILPTLDGVDEELGSGINSFMAKRCGQIATIARVDTFFYGGRVIYRLNCDKQRWSWNNHMILPFSSSLESWCYKNIEEVVDDFF